jgi:hypothetical protein
MHRNIHANAKTVILKLFLRKMDGTVRFNKPELHSCTNNIQIYHKLSKLSRFIAQSVSVGQFTVLYL